MATKFILIKVDVLVLSNECHRVLQGMAPRGQQCSPDPFCKNTPKFRMSEKGVEFKGGSLHDGFGSLLSGPKL